VNAKKVVRDPDDARRQTKEESDSKHDQEDARKVRTGGTI
jgi:hypothetical protein